MGHCLAKFLIKPLPSSNSGGRRGHLARPRPRRRQIEYSGKDRAIRFVRSWQITDAHQKLVDDLPAGEAKSLPKQPRPFLRRSRVVGLEPADARPMRLSQRLAAPCILACRFDLDPDPPH